MAGFWRKCRFCFRCARFCVWAVVLLALLALLWCDWVGVPDFVKTRLVAALSQRGVQLEFTRMRWRPVHGLVCDNVRIGGGQDANGASLTAKEVQIRLSYLAMLHARLQVKGLVLRQGEFDLPLSAEDTLTLTNLDTELRFEAEDTWALDQFRAGLQGATVTLAGEVAHAPECRNWKMFSAAKNVDRGSAQSSLKSLSDTLKQIHLDGQPQLNVRMNGDARDVHSFTLYLNARVPGVQTPWFRGDDVQFTARVLVPANAPTNYDPAWGFWTNLQPYRLDWTARVTELKCDLLNAGLVDCKGNWNAPELAITNLSAELGRGSLQAKADLNVATRALNFDVDSRFDLHAVAGLLTEQANTRLADISWGQPPHVNAIGRLTMPPWNNRPTGWRDDIEPSLRLSGEMAFTNAVVAGMAPLDSVQAHFAYSNLVWKLPDLELTQGHTLLDISGEESDVTKDFHCVLAGKLDSESVRRFLSSSNAARGFDHLEFRDPVALALEVSGNLHNFDVLSATGRVTATDFAIRDQWIDSLSTTLAYSNLTAEFYHPTLSRAKGTEHFEAEGVTLDIAGEKLFIHHGKGHVLPAAVGNAIGPKTAEAMEPYHFLAIPDADVDGCIPLKHNGDEVVNDDADLWVDVVGTAPFQWKRFQTPAITGRIHWLNHYLILTNVVSECYSGRAQGWGSFDVQTPGDGTDFSFFIDGTNVDFHAMGRALWSPTNNLRGALSGTVMVTHANSSDWRTWNGYGHTQLRNGVLWDAPVLGLMSHVLNTITPGLDMGNSRATDGAGWFTMTNGVIYTDTLEIRSMTMRIDYAGTVDLDLNISARAKAELLRNTPYVGSVMSMVLMPVSKAFECDVRGTLDEPRITPVYIPFARVLAAPLHPIRTVQELFTPAPTNGAQGKTAR